MRIELELRSMKRKEPNLPIQKNQGMITCCPSPLVTTLFCNTRSLLNMCKQGFE